MLVVVSDEFFHVLNQVNGMIVNGLMYNKDMYNLKSKHLQCASKSVVFAIYDIFM